MKNTFKKVVGLLLAVLMVVSVCTVAFATETETETVPTFENFGLTEGTGFNADKVVEFEGEYVIQMGEGRSTGSGNYNLKLADPTNPGQAFVAEDGKSYAVLFDYYLFAPVSFQVRPMAHPTTSGQRGDAYKDALTGYSTDFVGDGKWHTAAIPFDYKNVTGGGVTLNNIGLLHQCNVDIASPGYIKNIRIVEEDGKTGFGNDVLNISDNIDNSGNFVVGAGMSSNYQGVKYEDDGTTIKTEGQVILNADDTVTFRPITGLNKGGNIGTNGWYSCISPVTAKGQAEPYKLVAGREYTVSVRYKVATYHSPCSVGIGYSDYGKGSTQTYIVNKHVFSGVSDGWQTLTATFSVEKDSNFKVTLSATGNKANNSFTNIILDDIYISWVVDGASSNIVTTNYNDNGLYTYVAGYKGVDVTFADGANRDNLALGEKFLGWYTDANCTEAADKVVDGTVYAKYPTVFIDDFNALKNYASGNQKQGSVTLTDGTVTLVGNTGTGFVVPAYDDEAITPAKFIPGKQYYVSVYYKSVNGNTNSGVHINMITGDRYGTEGARTGNNLFNKLVLNESTNGVVSQYFTQAELEKKDKSGLVENMILRADTQDKVSVESVITRIAITDPALVEEQTSEEMLNMGSIRKEKVTEDAYTSAGIRFRARVSDATRDAASEIGFVAVPTAYLGEASIADYVATEGNKAVIAKVKSADKEIVYDIDNDFYQRGYVDYQMIMTGLTRNDTDKNLLGTKMTVALYVTIDGVTTYTDALSFSYNDIAKYY